MGSLPLKIRIGGFLLAMLSVASVATADDAATADKKGRVHPRRQKQGEGVEPDTAVATGTLTDNWFGLGKKLEPYGLSVSLKSIQIFQDNAHGGLSTHRRAGRYTGSYDLIINLDLNKAVGWKGGSVYARGQGGWSDGINDPSVGALFNVNDDAVGDIPIYLSELYFDQAFFDERIIVRVGKQDLTGGFECQGCPVAFDTNSCANDEDTQFLNSALVNNPTIPFPDKGLGIAIDTEPTEWWYISAAVADADANPHETGFNTTFHGPCDLFVIAETGLTPLLPSKNGKLIGGYRVGLWYDSQPKERFDGGIKRDDMGFYVSVDQKIYKENDKPKDEQGMGVFARYGWADPAVSEVTNFWSVGAQYVGLIPKRNKDVFAFGVAQGLLSPKAGFTRSNETVMETYYNAEITDWMRLTPSCQYVMNPGGNANVENAFVVAMRLQISF